MELIMSSPISDFYDNHDELQAAFEAEYLRPGRRGRPRKNKMYFTPVTEAAIVAYNQDDDQPKRNKIYKEHIHYPLYKMAENLIHRFKFYYMDGSAEDVKYEVISFLLEKLGKYTPEKGRAFSYFSIVAKNYLIQNNNKSYKRLITRTPQEAIDNNRNVVNEIMRTHRQESLTAFLDHFIKYYDAKVDSIYKTDRDRSIAYAVLELFKNRDNIENYNKKALYIMIREMTGTKTQYITKVVNEIKSEYSRLFKIFEAGRTI